MRYCEVVEEAKKRFPNSPSRQNDSVQAYVIVSYSQRQKYENSRHQKKKLRIR